MKKICSFVFVALILVVSVFFVLAEFVDDGSAAQNVTSCGVLNTSYAVYTLNQSIGSGGDGDCLIIANESLVIDCAGYNITYGNSSGGWGIANINESSEIGYTNVTIRNCVIIQNGSSGVNSSAIFFGANSTNAMVYNNTVITYGNGSAGIFFEGDSVSVNVSLNNATTSGNDSHGIFVGDAGDSSNLDRNTVATSGIASYGILLNEDSVNGVVFNNTVTTSEVRAAGIFLHTGGSNATVERNVVTTSEDDSSGINMGDSLTGLVFNNTVVVSGNLSSMDAMGGIFLEQSSEGINVSLNDITMSGINNAGIWIWGANHSVDGNTITATGEYGDGIYLADGVGTNLTSNTITVSGNASYGIYSVMSESSPLLFYNNVITTSANHSDGIHLWSDSYNNMSSNNITTTGNDSNGIYFNSSHHAILSGNIIKTGKSDSYVIHLLTAANHSFYNNIFNTSTSGSGVNWVGSDVSYFNTTNSTPTNIVGKTYIGGNFWTNDNGNGYSDTCTNLNGDYFCDSRYDVVGSSSDSRDYLPLSAKIGWNFNGTVMDANGVVLNNSVVNITLWTMGAQGPTLLGSNSSNSGVTGVFNTFIEAGLSYESYMYKSVITHANVSTGAVDYVGQVLPVFPYAQFSALSDVNFYLKEAGTINVTAVNATGSLIPFGYMIKDTKLGYEVSMSSNTSASGALVYVPRDRNYSIMVWPADGDSTNQFVPVSYDWNNFSGATVDYDIGSLSKYNYTTKVLSKQFNVSESFSWVSGYINKSGIAGWDNFTIVPYLLEPSDMIGMTRGGLPYNASAWRSNATGPLNLSDQYNVSSGFYNITLPYSAMETVKYLLLAVAENGSTYYGSYRNITVDAANEALNFTMYDFLGNTSSIINMSDSMDGSNHIVNLTKQTFNLVNASSDILQNMSVHIEIGVDYSDYGCVEFTFMEDISSSSGSFSIPLLSMPGDEGIKEMNVYSQTYAPRRVSIKTGLDIQTNPNVTMSEFSPGATDGASISGVQIGLYISNSTCDVPNPSVGCVATSSANLSEFNPLNAVVGGGSLSFRMGLLSTGIIIHYVNVDLLASGPPSGEFESGTSESTSSGFESALKFGSNGPTIYDYILISMPYTEGSSSVAGLNESADVNLSIPKLYDESWSSPIWDTSLNGTNGTLLAANYSHYSARSSEWATLIGDNICGTNVSEFNATNPCYINTTSNRIWVRLPHFSGTEPSITGSATTVTTTPSDDGSSSGGGGGTPTYNPTAEKLSEGYTVILRRNYKVKFSVDSENHTLNVDSVGENSVNITISSEPQTKTLFIGDEVKFELDGDNVYDFSVKLNSISGGGAELLMKTISEEIPEGEITGGDGDSLIDSIGDSIAEVVEEAKKSWMWWLVGGLVLLMAVVGAVVYFKKK